MAQIYVELWVSLEYEIFIRWGPTFYRIFSHYFTSRNPFQCYA